MPKPTETPAPRAGHYRSDRAGDLKRQREAQDFDRMMATHRRETTPEPGEPLGRMHALKPLKPLSRVVARGRSQVNRAIKGKR